MLDRVADVLRELLFATPPSLAPGKVTDLPRWLDAMKLARRFHALDLAGRRDVLDLFTKSAGDMLDRWFESAPIKAAFGFDAVVGNFREPVHAGLGLRAAAPRVRRGQRPARPVGPRDRRDGRDHAGDGKGVRGARRDAARRRAGRPCRGQGRTRGGRRARKRRDRRSAARDRQRQSEAAVRASRRPRASRRRFPRAHRGVTAADRARSG